MSVPSAGTRGEDAATQYLERHGFKVIERNFKTPRCEIDVIAEKGNCLYFVEVKYRSTNQQGGGLDAITYKKVQQMGRAAAIWLQLHSWHGEVTLSACEVAADYEITDFIESLN